MKKLSIAVVFIFSAALMGMTAWAAAIGSGALNTFSSGNTLSSTEMNDNFTVIENAVNASNALQATLPDGVTTYLNFFLTAPDDYTTGGILVLPYWSGCEGADVTVGFSTRGYFTGDNASNIIFFPTLSTKSIPTASALNFTITQSLHTVANGFANGGGSNYNFLTFSIGRPGADVGDTCTGDLRLWGVKIIYPNSGGSGQLFIPAHAMSR